jgi:hypothetical protein
MGQGSGLGVRGRGIGGPNGLGVATRLHAVMADGGRLFVASSPGLPPNVRIASQKYVNVPGIGGRRCAESAEKRPL